MPFRCIWCGYVRELAAYKHFGATLKNEQWSWSAITPGGEVARDHRDGLFRVVVITAVDRRAEPRRIDEAYPQPNMLMRVEP
jgi:hypothetical protein